MSDSLRLTPRTAAHQASLSITNSRSMLKLMSIESVMPSNYLILCGPLSLPPSIFPSIRVLSSESVLRIRWPKYWSFSFSISPSNEQSGLISFRMDWLDHLAVQGALKKCKTHQNNKFLLATSLPSTSPLLDNILSKKKEKHFLGSAGPLCLGFPYWRAGLLFTAVKMFCRGGFCCCRARALGHPGFRSCGLRALEHRLSCPLAYGIFLDQGSNPCHLR